MIFQQAVGIAHKKSHRTREEYLVVKDASGGDDDSPFYPASISESDLFFNGAPIVYSTVDGR